MEPFLSQTQLLFGLNEQEIAALTPLCHPIDTLEAATIFSEGAPDTHLYVITAGQVAFQKSMRAPHAVWPRHTTVAVCQPGELIGWSTLIAPFQYTLSALAWSPTTLLRFESSSLCSTLETQPGLGFKVMRSVAAVVSRRLKQTMDALINARELPIWQQ
ncbi:MAG: cyclic nucleotide-binding domain-containing protein [SAR202 cluster bacterium]|nr:cyclic nucleotide-binding domain-containing protein [SAR202 cluster bacterium]